MPPKKPTAEGTVIGKYDRMALEATDVEGALFGIPLSDLMKDGNFQTAMRSILEARDEDPQVWTALYVQEDPESA